MFFLLTLILWIVIALRASCIKVATQDVYETVYDHVLFNDNVEDDSESVILGSGALHMRDSDIWSHYYRMYLIGENSISYPWYMPKDFPSDALNEVPKDRFLYFIKKE